MVRKILNTHFFGGPTNFFTTGVLIRDNESTLGPLFAKFGFLVADESALQ